MLEAGNHLIAQASTLDAKGNAALQAGGELQLLTADNEVYHFEQNKSKGLLKSKSTEIEQNLGAVLKELGSSANIKHLATSVALTGFNEWAGLSSGAPNAPAPYAQPGAIKVFSWDTFNRVTSNAGISAGTDSTPSMVPTLLIASKPACYPIFRGKWVKPRPTG
ncbi:hypothetical protein [Aeromonas sp. ASNIH4]|nr:MULTISPECIES: hypothetical protein [Aeromonas]